VKSVHHNSYCATHYGKILQKYSNFSFYNTVYSAHNENKIQYPDIDMCIGEPLAQRFPTEDSRPPGVRNKIFGGPKCDFRE